MAFTEEQQEIIYSHGNVKVIAVAGSGKSTTLFGYARYRMNERGLYLVYNNSARAEAKAKAKKYELKNLTVHTAHSLAYEKLKVGKNYRVVKKIPLDGIIEFCKIRSDDPQKKYTLAQMISDAITIRCNKMDDFLDIEDFKNYEPDTVRKYLPIVNKCITRIWEEMDLGTLGILHDFYLKKFVTELKEDLGYDYIVFDEGQDANEIMLNAFKRQKGTKVIVGDPSQQIYTWRGAINALDKVNYPKYNLSGCFRFGETIANKANHVLQWKKTLGIFGNTVLCEGLRTGVAANGPPAFLCRSTAGLFKAIVEFTAVNQGAQPIYLEGGLWGNDFLTNNRLMSDIYYLFAKQPGKVKGKMLKGFKDISQLQEFAKNTGNREVGSLIDLVFRYKSELFSLKDQIKAMLVNKPAKAAAIFSTVHKSKGQEYAKVILDDTFITEPDIYELAEAIEIEKRFGKTISTDLQLEIARANEEINIRYVAITRGKNEVRL